MKVLSLALLAGRPEGHFCFPFLLYESRFCRFSLNFASLVFYFSEKVVVNDCISILILNKQHESLYRRFDFFVYNLLLTLPSFIRIQFKILKLVFVLSYFYKAFVQFSSHSIKLILKQFWNYSAEENPCCIFFPSAFNIKLLNSFILVWHSDYELSSKTQKPFFILKESSKCHDINYRAKLIMMTMFCFGLQSIARFINANASYFNTHRLESEGQFSWNF